MTPLTAPPKTLSLFQVKETLRQLDSEAHTLGDRTDCLPEHVLQWRDRARPVVEHHLGMSVWVEIVRNIPGVNSTSDKGQYSAYLNRIGTAIVERAEALREGHYNDTPMPTE